jgi:hypothetical protein
MLVRGRSGTQPGYDSIGQSRYILGKNINLSLRNVYTITHSKTSSTQLNFRQQLVALTPGNGDNICVRGARQISVKPAVLNIGGLIFKATMRRVIKQYQ